MIKKPAKKSVKVAVENQNPLQLLVDALNALQSQASQPAVKTASKAKATVERYESITYPGIKLWKSNPKDKDSFYFGEIIYDELDSLTFVKDNYKKKK